MLQPYYTPNFIESNFKESRPYGLWWACLWASTDLRMVLLVLGILLTSSFYSQEVSALPERPQFWIVVIPTLVLTELTRLKADASSPSIRIVPFILQAYDTAIAISLVLSQANVSLFWIFFGFVLVPQTLDLLLCAFGTLYFGNCNTNLTQRGWLRFVTRAWRRRTIPPTEEIVEEYRDGTIDEADGRLNRLWQSEESSRQRRT